MEIHTQASKVQTHPGVGVGLRPAHTEYFLEQPGTVDWFELLIDNYLPVQPVHEQLLARLHACSTLRFHGVSMNLGGVDPLDEPYLYGLRNYIDDYQPALVSDHLCFSRYGKHYAHDLLPLPYTVGVCRHFADRIMAAQDILGCQIAVENVSTYVHYKQSTLPEWEFINQILSRADCLLLLDINNLYVNSVNVDTQAQEFLSQIDHTRVAEIHLAGYENMGDYLLDSHGTKVQDPVWRLYQDCIELVGPRPTLIEWDNNLPSAEVLLSEARRAKTILNAYYHAA